jgi:predicted N-acetyltransferase YhbS
VQSRTTARDTGSGGAQEAAEAMPYHMHRRTDCNTDRRDPGVAPERSARHPARPAGTVQKLRSEAPMDSRFRRSSEVAPARVEYQVRTARITDIERLVALGEEVIRSSGGGGPLDSGDLLRQLVYLPQASIFVVEMRREVVGGAVLALRPSVRAGGFVGTVDLLVVDPDHDADRVTDALLEEVIRSAQNKGCSVVEAALATDPAERTRWERHEFVETGPRTERQVAAVGAATRRSR